MSNENEFETEKYVFWFSQLEKIVRIKVATFERREFTDEDISELEEFLADMGKWETFVKVGKSLLEELGIKTKSEKELEKEFGFEKYQIIKFKKEDYPVEIIMDLTTKEIHARERRKTRTTLSKEEIMEQIKNVPKWQTLKKTISELKKQVE
ncbi:MAG: hypothetical protein ACFFCW_46780 [Candidatus Hodarchaeota archaeon]